MIILIFTLMIYSISAFAETTQKVYDFAGLLTKEEIDSLEELSNSFSQKRQVEIILLTTADTEGKDVVKYVEDFYDEKALGYDKPHGNAVILAIDMEHREVYVAGFYKGEEYLDDSRCDLIRRKITPDLSNGNYYEASHSFMELSYRYMGIRPGVNPENIIFKLWFQALTSIVVAGIAVAIMAYHSGGIVTTEGSTYLDRSNSGIIDQKDVYIRTTTTKTKKPSNDSKNSGGLSMGGGGISSGGHSHSGSKGKF